MRKSLENSIIDAVLAEDLPNAAHQLTQSSPLDVVSIMGRVGAHHAAVIFRLLAKDRAAEVFELLEPGIQGDIVRTLGGEDVVMLFAQLAPDDKAALLDELPAAVAKRLLESLPFSDQRVTNVILGYPTRSVGRWANPRVVALRPHLPVDEALQLVRQQASWAETIYTIAVVSDSRQLVGVVGLRDLLCAQDSRLVEDVMSPAQFAHVAERAEDVARRVVAQDWLALPVVDREERLVGIFTVDDAGQVLTEEEDEDSARAGASEPLPRPYLATSVVNIVRSRVVWLMVLAASALFTVHVLEMFETTLEQKVVLAAFIPLIIGTGGNTGTQAATTVTRALALGEVRPTDVLTVMFREVRVGFLLGAILGAAALLLATLAYDVSTGVVIGSTLMAICMLAATVGSAMPMIARTLRVDPAVFSTPFITTFCDATGLLLYFVIARAVFGL